MITADTILERLDFRLASLEERLELAQQDRRVDEAFALKCKIAAILEVKLDILGEVET